jgi:F0F1-type ATP synthase membrane subunit b/b'
MNAQVKGTVRAPTLAINSNLDRVVSDQLRNVVGAQVAAAEAKVRAHVDSLVDEKAAPVRARIASLQVEADKRIADARTHLDAEKQKLEAQLKTLGGGLVKLP